MNNIQEIRNNKTKYYLSITDEGNVRCGSHNAGNFYGLLEVKIAKSEATLFKEVSNGITSSMSLSPQTYSSATSEYKELVEFKKEVNEYLTEDVKAYQEENREALMQNTMKLFPAYAGFEA